MPQRTFFVGIDMKPFIHRFKTKKSPCIYDVNTNQIVRVDRCVYDCLSLYGALSPREITDRLKQSHPLPRISQALSSIESCRQQHGLFSASRPGSLRYHRPEKESRQELEENPDALRGFA